VSPTPVTAPSWIARNDILAEALGLDTTTLASPESLALFAGNLIPAGMDPVATAYAGHQFGQPVPQLGDGRAILLGDATSKDGTPYEIQLKGAGPTPFSRRGDGRAALGPVIREYVVSEAMSALGVPTTRALCAVSTGEPVYRQTVLPGAILTRLARSHLRVGTFEYFAMRRDHDGLRELTLYALKRLYPGQPLEDQIPELSLLELTVKAQANLIAQWMAFGFVHGVMNTDNTSISGETIDYGPCAFLDGFVPSRTFSSIDTHGRYAYNKQPSIALWNLTLLARCLYPVVLERGLSEDDAAEKLHTILGAFQPLYDQAYQSLFRRKLGLITAEANDSALIARYLDLMAQDRVDFAQSFRLLTAVAGGADPGLVKDLYATADIGPWLAEWQQRIHRNGVDSAESTHIMKAINPVFIPRHHLIESAIAAAIEGNLAPFQRLMEVLSRPFDDQPGARDLSLPPGDEQWEYRTFCGT
jgi:serine/tyrosine/threonine adenylyltransferase